MNDVTETQPSLSAEFQRFTRFFLQELKPKGPIFTPFNLVTGGIMLLAAALLVVRYVYGLSSITEASQYQPWGLWVGFNVVTGVAFAGGAYVLTFMVYVLNMHKYHSLVRVVVLNGFLAYVFYAGALLLDLGRPWNVINPIIGNSFGLSSVLFLVAWHFMLYMMAQFVEFSPAVTEWARWPRLGKLVAKLTLGAVIFGISLSLLHQSGLGALFLMAKPKIHPLWYSEFIPILFLLSSIFGGLSVVIVQVALVHKYFPKLVSPELKASQERLLFGLAKICSAAAFMYVFAKILDITHGAEWGLLASGWGAWWMLEVFGLGLVPSFVFLAAYRKKSLPLVYLGATLSILGVLMNRINVSMIAFQYQLEHHIPPWGEWVVAIAVICVQLWVFRWIINRMPVVDDKKMGASGIDLVA